ncbi:hypothetical protein KFE25_003342 [Diacronema lutheri]|uniref:Uncharacterized protein n=1 Tax=Diacronema lutheri TaxID=2081491 RepID=A0A8J5XHI1_DIALT|nr:hypothetical protein KFE25_003342 [Diacronema lutheri]
MSPARLGVAVRTDGDVEEEERRLDLHRATAARRDVGASPTSPATPDADPYDDPRLDERTRFVLRSRAREIQDSMSDPRAAELDEESRFLIHRRLAMHR